MRPERRPIAGADGRAICRAVRTRGLIEPVFVERVDELAEALRGVLRDGDVVLTMGAGNIGAVAQDLKSALRGGGGGMNGALRSSPIAPEYAAACPRATCPCRATPPGTSAGRRISSSRRATSATWRAFVRQLPAEIAAALDRARQQSAGARRRDSRRRHLHARRARRASSA